jgi:hypothetical protein
VIVHGQTNLLKDVIAKLILKGFKEESIQLAKLDEAGKVGDYVAMVWPPGRPQEIIVVKSVKIHDRNTNHRHQVRGKQYNKTNFIEYR